MFFNECNLNLAENRCDVDQIQKDNICDNISKNLDSEATTYVLKKGERKGKGLVYHLERE